MSAILQETTGVAEPEAVPADAELVERIRCGETWLFETLMRRHNQKLFRLLRSMLQSASEAEDAMQEVYFRAFAALDGFEGRAAFSTWLLRIAAHEAMARGRKRRRFVQADPMEEGNVFERAHKELDPDPEARASASELRTILTEAIDSLPDTHRTVFVLREVEGLSTAETAEALGLSEENVKVRLHRARAALRTFVDHRLGASVRQIFLFDGARCDRVVARVMERLAGLS